MTGGTGNTPANEGRAGKLVLVALLVLAAALLMARPIAVPPLWFDEGWVLSVARNWVEHGHYGQLLEGKPASASMLNTGFPAIVPIAVSFKLLGVGIWQGRLPSALFTIGALWFMYLLARGLYGHDVGLATIVVLLLLTEIPPVIIGKQALGELPALFYLLSGFFCFMRGWDRSSWLIAGAIVLWGLALATKLQMLPFLTLALLVPASVAVARRQWKPAMLICTAALGTIMVFVMLRVLQEWLLQDQVLKGSNIYLVTAFVPVLSIRVLALEATLLVGLPTILGLVYAGHRIAPVDFEHGTQLILIALLAFTGSWLAWYAFLSAGWDRYLFSALFIGSVFVARMIYGLTDGFQLSLTLSRGLLVLGLKSFKKESVRACLVLVLVSLWGSVTVGILFDSYVFRGDKSLLELADFINKKTPSKSLIEVYDMEVLFLLDRKYHYPPDQVQLDLDQRFQRHGIAVEYNALEADPDYLVVGPQTSLWHLYDPVLKTGTFRLLRTYKRYVLYERVR